MKGSSKDIIFIASRSFALYKSRKELILELIKKGLKVTIISSRDKYTNYFIQHGASYFEVDFMQKNFFSVKNFFIIFRLIFLFIKINPKLIHIFHLKPILITYFSLVFTSIATLFTFNTNKIITVTGFGVFFLKWKKLNFFKFLLLKYVFKYFNLIIFQNNHDRDLLLKQNIINSKNSCLILGSGVNLQYFNKNLFHSKKNKNFVVLMIGRKLWSKGLKEFCQVANKVRKTETGIKFVWIGETVREDSHLDAAPKKWLEKQRDVDFLNFKDDIREYLNSANIFFFSSWYSEGMPRVVLEAQAFCLPVIAYSIPGINESILNNKSGYILDKIKDVDTVVNKIQYLFHNKQTCLKFGTNGRVFIEANFDIKKVHAAYMAIYKIFKIV